jgi:hypothetical protein
VSAAELIAAALAQEDRQEIPEELDFEVESDCEQSDLTEHSDASVEPAAPSQNSGSSRASKRKAGSKYRRRVKRKLQQLEQHTHLKAINLKRKAEAEEEAAVLGEFNVEEVPVSFNAWSGTRQRFDSSKAHTAEELIDAGMTYVVWDGIQTRPILDKEGRLIVLLAGSPRDRVGWEEVKEEMAEAIEQGGRTISCGARHRFHKRGVFPALTVGPFFGGGAKVSGTLFTDKRHSRTFRKLATCAYPNEMLRAWPASQKA